MWDHKPFEAFMAGRDPARTAEDRAWLSDVFNRCAANPRLAAPLAWAQKSGVAFFFDRLLNPEAASAYYATGHGVIGLSTDVHQADLKPQAATIVHEVRHAWQDSHCLLQSHAQGFAEHFMTFAAVEADAYSFERQVASRPVKDPAKAAAQRFAFFKEWYEDGYLLDFYSTWALKNYRNPSANDDMEFVDADIDRRRVMSLTPAQLYKLGEDFSGVNMFDHVDARAFLEKIARPELALTFYDAARKKPTPEVKALCLKHNDKTYKKLFGI